MPVHSGFDALTGDGIKVGCVSQIQLALLRRAHYRFAQWMLAAALGGGHQSQQFVFVARSHDVGHTRLARA